jgi:transposase InsO family protein
MRNLSAADLVLLERIKELKSLHPFFGYRRIWAVLRFRDGLNLNKKKVYRLMKINDLLIKPNLLLRANRTPWKDKPRSERLNEWWGIDMTKIRLKHLGWVYITIVIDWCSKKLVGYSIDTKSKSSDWLIAVDMALNSQFPYGVKDEVEKRGYELNLMADNGCQPTSTSFKETWN